MSLSIPTRISLIIGILGGLAGLTTVAISGGTEEIIISVIIAIVLIFVFGIFFLPMHRQERKFMSSMILRILKKLQSFIHKINTMTTSKAIHDYFHYIRNWTINSLRDITPEKAVKRPDRNMNTILWIAGHLLWTEECLIAVPLGLRRKFDGIKLEDFTIGSKPSEVRKYKNRYESIVTYLAGSADELGEKILNVKDKEWHGKWKGRFNNYFPDRMVAVKHCIIHEATHTGQIWLIEKFL